MICCISGDWTYNSQLHFHLSILRSMSILEGRLRRRRRWWFIFVFHAGDWISCHRPANNGLSFHIKLFVCKSCSLRQYVLSFGQYVAVFSARAAQLIDIAVKLQYGQVQNPKSQKQNQIIIFWKGKNVWENSIIMRYYGAAWCPGVKTSQIYHHDFFFSVNMNGDAKLIISTHCIA